MIAPARVDASVLIATYNRAPLLDESLASIRHMTLPPSLQWEVIVVDNNSTDDTKSVVERHARDFPVAVRYIFEPQQGRSSALNTAIHSANGAVLAFTDDDVVVGQRWLAAATEALAGADASVVYAGGPVRPIWEINPPAWFDLTRGDLWGTVAIQDHGNQPFVYEDARKVPLGANMAARRELFEHIGDFRPDLGRRGGRLVLGQEVPELLMRVRRAGLRGIYVPAMELRHHIPARRLTRAYFRTWWFGKGVSRATLDRLQPVTEDGVDLARTPHILRVPRTLYGAALRHALHWVSRRFAGRVADAFRHEMMLTYLAGYFWARQRERRSTVPGFRSSTVRRT